MILHLDFSRWLLFLFVASSFKETKTCEDGDIRLAGGPNDFEGRLESCSGSTWGHVCGTGGWGRTEGEVVCRHLGYLSGTSPLVQSIAASRMHYGAQEGPAFVNQVQCTGSELAFDNCSKEVINETGCSTLGGFVYIVCQDPECEGSAPDSVRLVGGLSDSDGRVEVCDNDGRRRQVCQDGWDDQDATVVCRTLGFLDGLDAVSVTGLLISVTLPAYSSVNCSGSEESFTHCVPSTSTKLTFPTNQCNGFAGVICSDPQPNTPTPSLFPSSTIGTTSSISRPLLGSSTKTQPTGSPNTLRPVPTVQPTGSPNTLRPVPTVQPTGSPNTLRPVPTVQPTPGATDNMLLIIVVGVVGGAIVLLLLLVLILFILILLRRNHSSDRYNVSPENNMTTANGGAMNNGNGHLEHPPIPLEDLENSIKENFQPLPPRHRTSSEYDHVLLNPLYGNKMRSRSNTIISDQSSVFEDPGYSDIKGAIRKRSSLERTLNDKLNPYSTPSDTISQKSHSPRQVHSNTASNRDLSLQPYVDEQGYAALESQSHIYDEMNVNHMYDDVHSVSALSTSMRQNLVPTNELLLSASPYEMPAIGSAINAPSNESVLRGSLLSPEHKFGVARSTPNLSLISPQRGFRIPTHAGIRPGKSNPNIASHEYRELEDIATRTYDSPKNARGYEEPVVGTDNSREYEDPIMVREHFEVREEVRNYESPVITITGEREHEYNNTDRANTDRAMERNMELETIPE